VEYECDFSDCASKWLPAELRRSAASHPMSAVVLSHVRVQMFSGLPCARASCTMIRSAQPDAHRAATDVSGTRDNLR
jgi:hypothetical protein